MWGQVLTSKYGGWHGLMGNSALSCESHWWKDLEKLCGSEVDNPWFEENTVWKIGRGDKCRFWKDVWVNGNSLANLRNRLPTKDNLLQRNILGKNSDHVVCVMREGNQ